jgi:hypothetical protein
MGANWGLPTLSSAYADFLTELKNRDVDSISLQAPSAGIPTGAIRYNRSTNIFEEYDGGSWVAKVLAVAGGGTGASTASGARTNLGLGSIATQSAASVSITGGTAADIDLTYTADGLKAIGSNTNKLGKVYIKNGCVLPVGIDKYLAS